MKQDYITIHKGLHDRSVEWIKIGSTDPYTGKRELLVKTALNGCRYVNYEDEYGQQYEIMVQNPKTQSSYAARARKGEKLTWVIPTVHFRRTSGKWRLITDETKVD